MSRPFLFLAGEFAVTMPLVFTRDHWQHTMTARKLVPNDDGTVRRDNQPAERLAGVLYFASVDDERLAQQNLELLDRMPVPCWPDPAAMLRMANRHEVMKACLGWGLVNHEAYVIESDRDLIEVLSEMPRPFVLKTGNLHCGEGKRLIRAGDALPEWEGAATVEPFFEGVSARVLILGDEVFTLRFDNPDTWIKNAAGAEVAAWPEMPRAAIEHAWRVCAHFGLEVAGVDYVIGHDGAPHFLEINQFPGLAATPEIEAHARTFLGTKMDWVERRASARSPRP